MTAEQLITRTEDQTRFRLDQAARIGAALRGELGIDAQLLAMSEEYKRLRLLGQHDAAAVIKAEAQRIHNAAQEH